MFSFISATSILFNALLMSSHADLQCVQKLEDKKLELAQVQDDYNNGDKNIIELLDAKLETNQQAWDCGLVAKYNYCKYQQDVMNSKIKYFKKDPNLETPQSSIKLTEDKLEAMIDFCIHPDQDAP